MASIRECTQQELSYRPLLRHRRGMRDEKGPRMRCGKDRGRHGARAWRVGEGASAATAGSPSSSAAVVASPIITPPRPRQRPPAQSFSFSLPPPSSSPRHQTSIIAAARSLGGLARLETGACHRVRSPARDRDDKFTTMMLSSLRASASVVAV